MSGDLMVIVAEVEVPLEILSKTLRLQVRKLRLSAGTQQAVAELSLSSCCFFSNWGKSVSGGCKYPRTLNRRESAGGPEERGEFMKVHESS